VAGRVRSIEKSNDIGNLTRDLPASSIVPQTTTPPRVKIIEALTSLHVESQEWLAVTFHSKSFEQQLKQFILCGSIELILIIIKST
jgi:hypothetical protein